MKITFSLLVILLLSGFLNAQISIDLTNGNNHTGFITNSTNDDLSIKTIAGENITIKRSLIKKLQTLKSNIQYINGKSIVGYVSRIDDKSIYITPDNILNSNEIIIERKDLLNFEITEPTATDCITLGLTFGTPGFLNLNTGYELGNFGFRASLGAMPPAEIYGTQFNFLYNIYNKKNVATGFSLATGYFYNEGDDMLYIAPMYHINVYGVFLEMGLGIGESNVYTNPQILFQIGYIHRFN